MRGWFNLHPKALTWGACLLPLLLSACATHPARPPMPEGHAAPPPVDTTYLPRLLLPGASLPEVRSLAMGAARSRGWTVRQEGSSDDRFIVERPADPAIVAQVAPQMAEIPGSKLEVTTFLKEEGGMLEVAMRAELVIPQPAGGQPMRIDYTEAFSPALMQSLEALRERWIQDRERLARATPPPEGWRSAWDESADPISTEIERPQRGGMGPTAQPAAPVTTAAASASAAQPQTRSATPSAATVPLPRYDRQAAVSSRPQAPAAASGSPARPTQVAAASQAKPQAPVIDASRPATAAQTRPPAPQAASAARPAPSATSASRATPSTPPARPAPTTAGGRTAQTQPSAGTRPAAAQPPAPTRTAPAPTAGVRPGKAPAAVNRPAQTQQPQAAGRPTSPAAASPTRPAQTATPPAARPTSTPAAANRTPPAKAEQYARQRGCRAGGAQLIESRRDGEVYRVPCQGSDSLLVHCRAGSCKGLL